jgi:holin-like protein
MTALHGLARLLLMQAAGEALVHARSLPFPGPVVGTVLPVSPLMPPAFRWPG